MKNRNIILFLPNTRWYGKRPWMQLPFNIAILTSILKKECNLKILDANAEDLTEEECLLRLKELKADMILISGLSVEYYKQYERSFELAKTANQNCITVFGGVYPTLMPNEILIRDKNVDYVFIGHAEERIIEFIGMVLNNDKELLRKLHGIGFRDKDNNIIINPVKTFVSNIQKMAKPDYSLLDINTYITYKCQDVLNNTSEGPNVSITTSIGCPYNCFFCASSTITGRKIIFRPVEDVLEEIDLFYKKYGVRNITIVDENFLAQRKRVEAILKALIGSKYDIKWQMANTAIWHLDDKLLELMKKSGCTAISPSIESGSPRVLRDLIGKPLQIHEKTPGVLKKCRELGIDVIAHFVIGLPGESWDEIRETFRYAETNKFDMVVFHIATPYPKTALYDHAIKNKLLPESFNFYNDEYYGTSRGFITTDQFTPFELMILRAFEWDRINFSTTEKTAKIAKMMRMTLEELNAHRKQTRIKCGVHY